jgi:hypothetical protein
VARRPRSLTRSNILKALRRLGELCVDSGIELEVALYGGVVMMLAYDRRTATRDVDAIFRPVEAARPLIGQVATELGLPSDWMNDGVLPFVARREDRTVLDAVSIPGLRLTRPTARYLLAMKCLAARLPTAFRRGDLDDIVFLLRELRTASLPEVEAIVTDYYGRDSLGPEKRWLIEELIKEASRGQSS